MKCTYVCNNSLIILDCTLFNETKSSYLMMEFYSKVYRQLIGEKKNHPVADFFTDKLYTNIIIINPAKRRFKCFSFCFYFIVKPRLLYHTR